MLRTFEKTDEDRLLYTVRLSRWLLAGESLAEVVWTVESETDAPPALEIESQENDSAICTVWVRGGRVGHEYTLTVRATTNAAPIARTKTKSFVIRVVKRR